MTPSRLSPLRRATKRDSRVSVPSVLQMEAVECGAASLAMILAYFGRIVSLEELRVACGVSRDGSRAQNLLNAARGYGLVGKAFRKEIEDLRTMRMPLILHWNFNHFLVLEGIQGKRVFLNDPASGPRTVPESELDASFTGVALSLDRGPTFEPGGSRPALATLMGRRLVGSYTALAFLFIAGLLVMMMTLVTPAFLTIFIDDVLVKGTRDWAAPLAAAMVAAGVALALFQYVQQYYQQRLLMRMSLSTSLKSFSHLLTLPVGFFMQRGAGELSTRVAINDRIAQVLSSDLMAAVLGACAIGFYASVMLKYDVWLTFAVMVTTALNVASIQFAGKQRVNLTRRLSQDQGKMMGTAMGGLQSIETLKAMGTESEFFSRWAGFQSKVLSSQQGMKLQTELLSLVPAALTMLNTALILGIGGYRVMDGRLSIGMLIAFQTFAMLVATPAGQLVTFGASLQDVEGQITRVEDILQTKPDPQARPPSEGGETSDKLDGALDLKDVTFGYNPVDEPLIRDFNLTIKPGNHVALVGGSGSGKSTIARLVCGLYKTWSGIVAFDGVPRDTFSHHQLSHSFAIVDQDIFLFEGTVRENLTLWDTTVPDADVVRAATDACIHDEIMSRPGGYNSRVDEGGRNFSGGQAQRLEIARALVGNPSILVLDEATSALDPTTERIFDDNLRRRGCTCLLIAHRLSTIRDCDEIVVLEQGRMVQRGTHEEMSAVPGPYASLIASGEH